MLITGAGSGIGAAAARKFSAEGANVTLMGRRADKLEEVAAYLPAARTLTVAGDVSDEGDVERVVAQTVARFGRLDVLVNNAGVGAHRSIKDMKMSQFDKVMAINVRGLVLMSQQALPHLIGSKGNIVNVGSVSGIRADWKMAAYNAAKGAVTNLTRSMAIDLGRDGVRVNEINPSLTLTEMTAGLEGNEKLLERINQRMPLGRIASADEVAGPILFLASDEACFVTGVSLPVDGGMTASNGQPRMF